MLAVSKSRRLLLDLNKMNLNLILLGRLDILKAGTERLYFWDHS